MARKQIEAGQRFRCLKPLRSDWAVVQVYGQRPGTSHVVMVELGDTTTTKTLACSILLDPQRYRLRPLDRSEDSPARDRVLTVRTGESYGRVEIIVEDNGPGISHDVMPRILEPLFSTRGVGVGLGLSVVEHIMKRHGGGIEIESEEGRGTRVCRWLPHGCPIR